MLEAAAVQGPRLVAAALGVLLALALSAWLSVWLAGATRWPVPGWLRVLDHPNARSLHSQPIPRSGGLALIAGFAAGLPAVLVATGWPDVSTAVILGALLAALALVGALAFVDDRHDLPRRYRLLGQFLAAVLLSSAGLRWDSLGLPGDPLALAPWLAWPLSLVLIVWMINLYNFMDGMDGLAASMAVFGFGALGGLGILQGAWLFALLNALVVAAALGFLRANFPPARLFMGDLGASALGLLAAGLSLWGARDGLFPLWVAALAFSPFIVDATWTLLRRARKRERIWEAHRSHHYQRLVLAGWTHRQTLTRAIPLMGAAAASAMAAPSLPDGEQWMLLIGWAGIYGLIHWRVALAERAAGAA